MTTTNGLHCQVRLCVTAFSSILLISDRRKGDRYYFHTFGCENRELLQYHGRSFSKADVRFLDPPKPELCAWHYRQAVLKYIRARRIGLETEAP